MIKARHILLFASATLFASVGLLAKGKPGHIQGRVLDDEGKALARAEVKVYVGEEIRKEVVANNEGAYSFAHLEEGVYTVVARKPTYLPERVGPVQVPMDSNTPVLFHLQKEKYSSTRAVLEDLDVKRAERQLDAAVLLKEPTQTYVLAHSLAEAYSQREPVLYSKYKNQADKAWSGIARSAVITGVVTDPTGAVISSASVTVQNKLTGERITSTTDFTGAYTVMVWPVGNYEISVSAPGFKTTTRSVISVAEGAALKLDFRAEF